MKSLTLIRGIPGSGKSTLAMKLADAALGVHLEADQYFIDSNGDYKWNGHMLGIAHNQCWRKTDASLNSDQSVFVSNTFTTKKELRPYFELAKNHGIVPVVITCNNNWGSIHGVPEETINMMKNRFEHNIEDLFETKEETE
jgi:predicted kinase